MEENDRKRKAHDSSQRALRKKSSKKIKVLPKSFFSEDSSPECEKKRTPSGTVLSINVKDIRTFFSPKKANYIKRCALPVKKNSQSPIKKSRVGSSESANAINRKKTTKLVKHDKVRTNSTSKGRAGVSKRQLPMKIRIARIQRKKEESEKSSWCSSEESEASSEEDNYFTPTLDQSFDSCVSEDEENRFLFHLASIIPTVADKTASDTESEVSKTNDQSNLAEMQSDQNINSQADANVNTDSENCLKENMEVEDSTHDNPQVMNIQSVMEMMKTLKQEFASEMKSMKDNQIDEMKTELKQIFQQQKDELAENMKHTVKQVIDQDEEIVQVKSDVAFWKMKADTLADVCNRMYAEISDLTTRVENLELNNAKKIILITGLKIPNDKDAAIAELAIFFLQAMNLEVNIEDMFFLGVSSPRPVVVILQTVDEKKRVMQAKSALKHVKAPITGGSIYINDYLPPTTGEKRRREKDIIKMTTPDDPEEEHEVTYSKEGLIVQGQQYRKLIQVPTPKDLINIQPEEMEKLMSLKMKRSADVERSNSVFTAYTAPVENIQQIQEYYRKIRLIQPGARHVVCAYSIDHNKSFFAKDYQDDQEPGAGRAILQFMENNTISNRVILVARKYGGIKMGPERFECYVQAAKQAVQKALPDIEITTERLAMTRNRGTMKSNFRGRNNFRKPNGRGYGRGNTYRGSRTSNNYYPRGPQGGAQRGAIRGTRQLYSTSVKSVRQSGLNMLRGGVSRGGQQLMQNRYAPSGSEYQFSEPEYLDEQYQENWSQGNDGAWNDQGTGMKELY